MTSGQPPKKYFCFFSPCPYQTDDPHEAREHYIEDHFSSIDDWPFNQWIRDVFGLQVQLYEKLTSSPPSLPMLANQRKKPPLFIGCPVCQQIMQVYKITSANVEIEMKLLSELDYSNQRKHCNEHLFHKPITCKFNKDGRDCDRAMFTYREAIDHFRRDHHEEDLEEMKKFIEITQIAEIVELLRRSAVKPDHWPKKRCTDGPDSASKKKKTPQKMQLVRIHTELSRSSDDSESGVSADLLQPSTSGTATATNSTPQKSPQKLISDYFVDRSPRLIFPSTSTGICKRDDDEQENNHNAFAANENSTDRDQPYDLMNQLDDLTIVGPEPTLNSSQTGANLDQILRTEKIPVDDYCKQLGYKAARKKDIKKLCEWLSISAAAADEMLERAGGDIDKSFDDYYAEQELNSFGNLLTSTSLAFASDESIPEDRSMVASTSNADGGIVSIIQPIDEVVHNSRAQNVQENGETSSRVDLAVFDPEPPAHSETDNHQELENNASNNISELPLAQGERNQLEPLVDVKVPVKVKEESKQKVICLHETENFFCLFCSRQFQSRKEAVVHYSYHLDLHLRCLNCEENFRDTIETDAFDAFEAHLDERKSMTNDTEYEVGIKWINQFLTYQTLGIEQDYRRRDFCLVCYKINLLSMNVFGNHQTLVHEESVDEHLHRHLCYRPSFECRRCRLYSNSDQVESFKRGQEQAAIRHLAEKHQKVYQRIEFDSSEAIFEKKDWIAKLDDVIRNCKEVSATILGLTSAD